MEFSHVESSAWASSATSITPSYPSAAADGSASADDILYLTVHVKPDTATISPTGDWTLVEEVTGGAGTVGGGTGPTKIGVWRRAVPGGGLTGTTAVTLTSASVGQACISQYRPDAAGTTTWSSDLVSASLTSSSTDLAATASAAPSVGIADDDHVAVIVGAPDDQSTTQPVSTITASGATVASPTATPTTDGFSSLGNDIATSRCDAEVAAGSSSSAPSITGTAASSETRVIAWQVIRAEQTSGTTGALAGLAPQSTGALAAEHTAQAALAGLAPAAVGALTGDMGAGAITGEMAGIAPAAAASLSAVVTATGSLSGTAPIAVGSLESLTTLVLPLGAGVPALAIGWGTGEPVLTAGWRTSDSVLGPGWRAGIPT